MACGPSPAGRPGHGGPPSGDATIRREAAASAAIVFDRLLADVDEGLRPRWVHRAPSAGALLDGEDVVSTAGRPGQSAVARLWVHNTCRTSVDQLALALTDLVTPTGERLSGSAATSDPQSFSVPAGGSLPVEIRIALPADLPLGLYSGEVVCASTGTAAPFRLVVGG